jgi:hypothetical protein
MIHYNERIPRTAEQLLIEACRRRGIPVYVQTSADDGPLPYDVVITHGERIWVDGIEYTGGERSPWQSGTRPAHTRRTDMYYTLRITRDYDERGTRVYNIWNDGFLWLTTTNRALVRTYIADYRGRMRAR